MVSIPLPSPNQLKNRIIIKNKRLHVEDEKRLLAALQEGEKEIYEDDNIETYRTQIDDVTPKGDRLGCPHETKQKKLENFSKISDFSKILAPNLYKFLFVVDTLGL